MRREGGHTEATEGGESDDLLTQMIQNLLQEAETPPKEVEGVSEEFCDGMFYPRLFTLSRWFVGADGC
jgi:hypothetical protein